MRRMFNELKTTFYRFEEKEYRNEDVFIQGLLNPLSHPRLYSKGTRYD